MHLSGGVQLGYCTNVHAYSDVAGMLDALERFTAPLRARLVAGGALDADATLGVGLWFPAPVARALADDARPLADALARLRLHAFTVNAFPQGAFHGERVKDDVFRPAWDDPTRVAYTLDCARALAALLPPGVDGSISTHTGAYKGWGPDACDPARLAAGLLRAADGLAELERATGRRIVLALEPEPFASVETTDEALAFFGEHLHPAGEAARTHLGLCYDACHQAVQHEDMAASVAALRAAGIALAKVQISSAIVLPDPARDRALLEPFARDRWFHQVVLRARDGTLRRLPDLPDALTDVEAARAAAWRVHYHVPVFADPLDDAGRLRTTRDDLSRLLDVVADPAVTTHLELETYTWDAIPAARRAALGATDLVDGLAAEFAWVLGHPAVARLRAATGSRG
ncbi:MAG: metabolite traffic protein EboE [Planctomycetes bacterium]|nr:metabolite traffic protein EboE [Planctomycetota bacterium]